MKNSGVLVIFKVQNEEITISQTSQIVKHSTFFQDYLTTLILIYSSSTNQVFDSNDISFVDFQLQDILAYI